jgi:hypothetical protein
MWMSISNLRGRVRSWLWRREPEPGAIPRIPQPPPIPVVELPELESDIVVVEAEDPDLRAWAEAFTAVTGSH